MAGVDAQAVIDHLLDRIRELEFDVAMLKATLDAVGSADVDE